MGLKFNEAYALAQELLVEYVTGLYFYSDQLEQAQEYVCMLNHIAEGRWAIVEYYIREERRFCIRRSETETDIPGGEDVRNTAIFNNR